MINSDKKYIGVGCIIYNGHHYYVQVISTRPTNLHYVQPNNYKSEVAVRVLKSLIVPHPLYWFSYDHVIIPQEEVEEVESDNLTEEEDSNKIKTVSINTYRDSILDVTNYLSSNKGYYKVKYRSQNTKVAKVDKRGLVKCKKKSGSSIIEMRVKASKDSKWEVIDKIKVKTYYPKMATKKFYAPQGLKFNANSQLSGVLENPESWVSSNPEVVKIADDGSAEILSQGKAVLSPVYPGVKKKIKLTVIAS